MDLMNRLEISKPPITPVKDLVMIDVYKRQVYNGLKTLGLRMERHSLNAKTLADYLNSHPKINNVNYVGLPNHKGYEIAKKQMKMSGGMLSFEVKGGFLAAKKLMNALRLATYAPTLGAVSYTHLDVYKRQIS